MATDDKDTEREDETESDESRDSGDELERVSGSGGPPDEQEEADASEPAEPEGTQPAHLGATKYVHAAFFMAGILVAYLSGKLLTAVWNSLAEWPAATRAVPQLLRYAEDDRGSMMLGAGALVGVITVIQTYRKENIRRWADEVAGELARVTWPDKEMVTNGTLVVVIASAIATVYIALLDRFWSYLTTLVYGA